jgi:hypothetical protein
MNLSDEVDLEDYVSRPDKISAADVSAFPRIRILNIIEICTLTTAASKFSLCLI